MWVGEESDNWKWATGRMCFETRARNLRGPPIATRFVNPIMAHFLKFSKMMRTCVGLVGVVTVGCAAAVPSKMVAPLDVAAERYSWAEPRTDFFNVTGMKTSGECNSVLRALFLSVLGGACAPRVRTTVVCLSHSIHAHTSSHHPESNDHVLLLHDMHLVFSVLERS